MLTKKQKSVFVYICDFITKNGYAPTQEEIRNEFKLSSTSTAEYYLDVLRNKGYIKITSGKARAIEVIKQDLNFTQPKSINLVSKFVVPLLGVANAGEALSVANDTIEGYVELPPNIKNGKNLFALRVDGDSMNLMDINGKKISDHSIVFVDQSQVTPQENFVVLVIINGCATIKKFSFDRKINMIKLIPVSSNPRHKPILLNPYDDFVVNGTVVAVL